MFAAKILFHTKDPEYNYFPTTNRHEFTRNEVRWPWEKQFLHHYRSYAVNANAEH